MKGFLEKTVSASVLLLGFWLPLRGQAQQAQVVPKTKSSNPATWATLAMGSRGLAVGSANSLVQPYPTGPSFATPPRGINEFRFMEGVWKGNGWILNGESKQFFKETETVTTKLSAKVLQIEAFGVAVNDKTNIINDALGLLLYNNEKAAYELHIYQSDGSITVANAKLNNASEMEWSLTISANLKIKYVITVKENKWYEAGFKSTDGGVSWKQNFEMSLSKSGQTTN